MAVITQAWQQADYGGLDQLVAEQPTSPMPAMCGRPRPTLLLPLVERVGQPEVSTASLIGEAVEGFLNEHGSPPDIVLLSPLRYLSVCSQAGGYAAATSNGEVCVYIGYLPELADDEVRCAFVSKSGT